MPRLAANLSLLFPEQPFLDRFAAARAAGFDAVEFQFPYAFPAAEIADAARAAQLDIVLHNLPPGDWARGERGLACDPARRADFVRSVELAIDYARQLGVSRLHCMAGIPGPDADLAAVHRSYVANLRHAAGRAAQAGITLLIEPLNRFDVPGYFLATPAQAAAIIDEVGAHNLRLQCDLYHWQRIQGELAATVRALFPLIGHVQIADNPGRHEPGTGEINYPFLLALLDELGYDGWIGCEYLPRGDTVAGLAWRDSLSTSKT